MKNSYYFSRGDFSSIYHKIKSYPCKITFLGNSVTAQKAGYVHYLKEQLDTFYGKKNEYIHAGLGGMGALATCFITDDFVSRHEPDICFVECTVADIGRATPLKYLDSAVSGIIEKLMITGTKICFLHLYCASYSSINGIQTVALYENIANRYSIPSIHVGTWIEDSISKGILAIEDMVYDGIHTTAQGARQYANLIFEAFCSFVTYAAPSISKSNNKINSIYLPFQHTQIILPRSLVEDPSSSLSKARFRGLIKYIAISQDFVFTYASEVGSILGFLIIADEESGVLKVEYGSKSLYIQTSDEWCHNERIQAVILAEPIPITHKIRISLSQKDCADIGANGTANPTKKIGSSLKLIGFLEVLDTEPKTKYSLW